MATLKGWEFAGDRFHEFVSCEKCGQIVYIRARDEEYERLPKYNFCLWCDCDCSVCGYTENVDFPGNLGYKYCPSCGAPWDRKRG